MKQSAGRRFACQLVLVSIVAGLQPAFADVTSPLIAECPVSERSWKCFSELEVVISLASAEAGAASAIPLQRYRIQHFSNGELRVESESLPEKSLKTYLVALPSRVELFQGWHLGNEPLSIVSAELGDIFSKLNAAFPGGPASVNAAHQTALAKVVEYVYPIGNRAEEITVHASRTGVEAVRAEYEHVGEPIGQYRVVATWTAAAPAPLADGHRLYQTRTKSGLQVGTLGEARQLLAIPAPSDSSAN